MTQEHTPIPWHYRPTLIGHPNNRINPSITTDFDGLERASFIARVAWAGSTIPGMTGLAPATFEEAEANAEFIVLACNSHDSLLAALEKIQRQVAGWSDPQGASRLQVLADIDGIAAKAIEDAKR